ncbi:MAG: phosphopantothenate/pantothenate synthetase [Nanoarchaeota archaeon]|nr:phosphopantothenate/pantothenate synthetase [Nanoarchaeota archaeon]
MSIPKTHPRYVSLNIRDKIVDGVKKGITSIDGLIAHGRGEAFDYLLGEKTTNVAKKSIDSAAALLLLAKNPIISINGNSAALVSKELVQLSKTIPAKLEVNIFHSSKKRELKIKNHLIKNGAKEVLLPQNNCKIKYLDSNRKYVNKNGIYKADVVFVPLEDGDRTEVLIKNKKKVIVVDLNPLSRSAKKATIAIVDNIVRAIPLLIETIKNLKRYNLSKKQLEVIVKHHDNKRRLKESIKEINRNLV